MAVAAEISTDGCNAIGRHPRACPALALRPAFRRGVARGALPSGAAGCSHATGAALTPPAVAAASAPAAPAACSRATGLSLLAGGAALQTAATLEFRSFLPT